MLLRYHTLNPALISLARSSCNVCRDADLHRTLSSGRRLRFLRAAVWPRVSSAVFVESFAVPSTSVPGRAGKRQVPGVLARRLAFRVECSSAFLGFLQGERGFSVAFLVLYIFPQSTWTSTMVT